MKLVRSGLTLLALLGARLHADEILDRLADRLSASVFDDRVRARLSGTMELEAYRFDQPAPGLLFAAGRDLFAPRLALFLDAQAGPSLYTFAQARVDRGFDPNARDGMRVRLDEYAVRWSPRADGGLSFQVGKFGTMIGNWVVRHGAWGNAFVTAPVPYENLTGVWDSDAIRVSTALLQWSHVRPGLPLAITAREKYLRLPMIWGASYTTGVAVFGARGRFSYAGELKNASLSSRPEEWSDGTAARWRHPTVGGRLGWRPNEMWNLGISASTGSYLRPSAAATVPRGQSFGAYRQTLLAADLGFAWHHWQAWAEFMGARFAIPRVGNADTGAYYAELKYKFTPQWSGAVRWNRQWFSTIPDRTGPTVWGRDLWRIDLAPGFRFTPHTQLKLQYSVGHEQGGTRKLDRMTALQFVLRF